jgi:hypothetical protein
MSRPLVPGPSRIERIAGVLVEHAFDTEEGECMCGFPGSGWELAAHVAEQVEAAVDGAA